MASLFPIYMYFFVFALMTALYRPDEMDWKRLVVCLLWPLSFPFLVGLVLRKFAEGFTDE